MTCVSQKNLSEIPKILKRLAQMKNPPRKVMFLPVLGTSGALDRKLYENTVEKQASLLKRLPFQTNFVESVSTLLKEQDIEWVPCYVGRISFHIKANGDLFPCCLIGGEAVTTQQAYRLGNVHCNPLEQIRKNNMALPRHYLDKNSICRKVCQWKQMALNKEAFESEKFKLSMP
jgi:radical SAM protein with 4Fe4S-binding SPASM domain